MKKEKQRMKGLKLTRKEWENYYKQFHEGVWFLYNI